MSIGRWVWPALVLVVLSVSGCASRAAGSSVDDAIADEPSVSRKPRIVSLRKTPKKFADLLDRRALSEDDSAYKIAGGDVVTIAVRQVEKFSGSFRVSESGSITLPLGGEVMIAGLSRLSAESRVREALRRYLKTPDVTLTVSGRLGAKVSVMGGVETPGSYPLEGLDDTLGDVLTRAGGLTERAGPTLYFYPAEYGGIASKSGKREGSVPENAVAVDLTRMDSGQSIPELHLPLRSGDAILVPLAGEFYVDGWVETPGAFELRRGMTLTEGIALAGGLHFGASRGDMDLLRTDEQGSVETIEVPYGDARDDTSLDPLLRAGDRIVVASNPFKAGLWGLYSAVTSIFGVSATERATVGSED